ncbi:hypothetical protein MIMGU_mgv1a0010872mg, partial [Erythranthe guttata]
HSSLVIDKM